LVLVNQFYLEDRSHLEDHQLVQMLLENQLVLVVLLEVQMVLVDLVYLVPKIQLLFRQWLINSLVIHQLWETVLHYRKLRLLNSELFVNL
jgi:hypothetical protein